MNIRKLYAIIIVIESIFAVALAGQYLPDDMYPCTLVPLGLIVFVFLLEEMVQDD